MTGALIITLHISGHSLPSRKIKCISNAKYLVGAHFGKKKVPVTNFGDCKLFKFTLMESHLHSSMCICGGRQMVIGVIVKRVDSILIFIIPD